MRTSAYKIFKILEQMPVVFNLATFSAILNKRKKDSAVYVKKLVDSNILYRIGKGLYSKTRDPVVVAGNLPFPSYITGPFALFYWGEGEAPSIIDISTTEYKKGYRGWPFKFHIVKKLGKFTIANYGPYKIKIATKEQALNDIERFHRES